MKLLHTIMRLSLCAVGAAFCQSCHGADRSPSTLADDWTAMTRADVISGTYENRCSAASQADTSHTGLLSLVLGYSAMNKTKIKSAIKRVQIIQAERKISVSAEDVNGELVITRVLEAGRDYELGRAEVLITEKWDASDEWGSGKGTSVNSFIRSVDGYLLVKSVNTVRGRTFLFSTRNEVTYYFRFDGEAKTKHVRS